MRGQNDVPYSALPLGPGNPKPLGDLSQRLFSCPGDVVGIGDFARDNLGLLSPSEQDVVALFMKFSNIPEIPEAMRQCLTREADFANGAEPVMAVLRSGGRSAFSPDLGVKWKGCRPVAGGSVYPLEVLPFGATEISYTSIPFGTLSPEAVMREILGYCFFRKHGLPAVSEPICIYKYGLENSVPACCLVMATRGEERLEKHIEYPAATIGDVIAARRSGRGSVGGMTVGAELRLSGVNLWGWAERKSEILIRMHFNGGFRGVLNSNIGNDVLIEDGHNGPTLCLCDFDTFKIVELPENPNEDFIRAFILLAVVETIKGSLSIMDYVEIPADAAWETVAELLGKIYFLKSSLWKAYERRLHHEVIRIGWPMEKVRDAMHWAKSTSAVGQVLASAVLNSFYLNNMSKDRKVFYPHN